MALTAIVAGVRYPLDTGAPTYLMGDTGLGMSPVRHITEQGPFQHGNTHIDTRLQPRYFALNLDFVAASFAEHYDSRASLLDIFKFVDDAIKFEFSLENGDLRQIDGFYNGDLSFPSESREWASQESVVEIYCPDPTFYDPIDSTITITIPPDSIGSSWAVPMSVPTGVGTSTLDVATSINYTGSWLAYPIITIDGPFNTPIIQNVTTGETLAFKSGTVLAAGEQRIIDCRYGVKTVVDENGVNKIAELTDASDLATFHLSHKTPDGNNDFEIAGSGADANTQVFIRWNERFIGI